MTAASPSIATAEFDTQASGDATRLRALFVLNSLNVGGSEKKTVRLVNGLLRKGVKAGICYLNGPHELREALDPAVPVWNLERRGKFSASALRRLRAVIQEQQPACVLSVNLYPALYVALASARLRARPRTIALLNTTTLPDGEHWRRTFYRPFLRRMDRIVYGCGLQRSEWLSYLNADQTRSSVIYNGVDTEHFAPSSMSEAASLRARLGIAPQAFVIGTIGRLEREKNQKVLMDATAELRRRSIDAHLLLVGEGRRRAALEEYARVLRLQPHVTFAGVHADVRPLLQAMDVFVLPSTHVETFSNAALEAMAMRRPVVLSRVGGAAEMVRDGVEGYTVPVPAIAAELPLLLQRLHGDHDLRERLGRAARERVERSFSSQAMIDAYGSLIGGRTADQIGT